MKAGISANTVSRIETGGGAMVETLIQIQTALEKAGIVFIRRAQRAGPSAVRCSSEEGQTRTIAADFTGAPHTASLLR